MEKYQQEGRRESDQGGMNNSPIYYTNTGRFRSKAYRKATNRQALEAKLAALEGIVKVQSQKLTALLELNKCLTEQLAQMGIKVKLEKGELSFEAIRQQS